MATNAIGLNLLLQASNTQLKDLLQGLQLGDTLKGRIVDLLPEGKAVINLQGQNLLAQLPPPASGQSFQKGDVLSLEVTQASQAKPGAAPGVSANAPEVAVTLRIVPAQTSNAGQASGMGQGAAAASSPLGNTPEIPSQALPPVVVLEQALSAAKLPPTPANLAVVRTLAIHGLPLDAQTVQSVVQQAESLLATEQASQGPASQAAPSPTLAPPAQALLQNSLPALRLAVQTTPNAATRIGYQGALNLVEEALAPPTVLASPSAGNPTPNIAAAPPEPAAALPAPVPVTTPSLSEALQAVLKDPSPQNLQALQASLAQSSETPAPPVSSLALPQAAVAATLPSNSAEAPGGTTRTAASSSTLALSPAIALPVRREAAVLLIGSLPPAEPGQPLLPRQVMQIAGQLGRALQDPQSAPAQDLLRSVQAQFPEAQPAQVLEQAKQALDQVIVHFETLPPARPLPGAQALSAELEAATLPAPRLPLAQFPRELVFESVAWLRTRDLPPQRPLVEAAAQFLSRGQAALGLADKVVQAKPQLPESFLEWRPGLKQAFVHLEEAIQGSTLKLERADLAEQLSQWPTVSGLDLEKNLLASLPEGSSASAPVSSPAQAAPSLKEALAAVQQELKGALRDPAGAAPAVAPVLEKAAAQANQALQSLSALPLQAQASPSVQSITLPLALPLNGPLSNGQVTVSWRKGRDRELNDKEPVNVAVALQTESLGEVKVLMQVWKGSANVSVKAADQGTADYLQSGSDELKAGFAERTPFKLQNLGFDVAAGGGAEEEAEASLPVSPGLNLSA